MRFEIHARHYDPVKEEIEQRTSRIKKELEVEGLLTPERRSEIEAAYGSKGNSSIRGAFTQGGPIRNKPADLLSSAGMIRLMILLVLVGTITGYLYWGPDALYILLYIGLGIAAVLFFIRMKGKKNE
ncbi:hypothetical protein GCM10007049_13740 [Echinicola pacifica]|uniref:Uncharacterized protein n=2 Tax=Echinicola pacifica TaxID=346377 RepID=A0A918PVE9_9BACT|nr:hypothetical protein GCM10007049_13740 [Echinicola pacifica]